MFIKKEGVMEGKKMRTAKETRRMRRFRYGAYACLAGAVIGLGAFASNFFINKGLEVPKSYMAVYEKYEDKKNSLNTTEKVRGRLTERLNTSPEIAGIKNNISYLDNRIENLNKDISNMEKQPEIKRVLENSRRYVNFSIQYIAGTMMLVGSLFGLSVFLRKYDLESSQQEKDKKV